MVVTRKVSQINLVPITTLPKLTVPGEQCLRNYVYTIKMRVNQEHDSHSITSDIHTHSQQSITYKKQTSHILICKKILDIKDLDI